MSLRGVSPVNEWQVRTQVAKVLARPKAISDREVAGTRETLALNVPQAVR
jgi:hypothetical protein